jgi:hypothetical protein
MIRNMVMVYLSGRVEITIEVIMLKMRGMDMVKCIGQMGLIIRVSGLRVSNMAKGL